jgi:hypothetical protein
MRPLILFLLTALPLLAVERSWHSTNGNRSFRAEFLSSDGVRVTLERGDHRIITFPLDKLHRDDRAWVRSREKPPAGDARPAPEGAAFDTLEFGDSRKTVEDKLKASKFVSASVAETLFGRTGLNGIFKTNATIGGLHCFLYFDWTDDGALREVTLQTQPVGKSRYNTLLKANWQELTSLLGKLHGNPAQHASYPAQADLQDGLLLGSHLWHTEDNHSVLLCTGQEADQYLVAVRITATYIAARPR